ncbi:MAG: glycosyltransferase family 2 protein [Planctomycetota bacterium]
MRLSVAIVCKNNAETIGRTLDSVAGLADEIVAVDSGSTDQTIPMLEAAGARVIRSDWLGFVKTKNKALAECDGDWVLALDSDESVLPELAESIRAALDEPAERDGFLVNRKVFYRGRPLNHAWQPEWRLRLVRRGLFHWIGLDPHDHLAPIGEARRIARLAGDLRHDSIDRGFAVFLEKQARHARTMAGSMHAEGQRGSVGKLVTRPPMAMIKQIVLKRCFLDGTPGWLAAGSVAVSTAMKYAVLLEKTHDERKEDPESTAVRGDRAS